VLKYADELAREKHHDEAIHGLANTIMAFPDEGRYVPKMLDKLEAICREVPGAEKRLLDFYQGFLPKVSKLRNKRPNPYCMKLYKRAIERFQSGGRPQVAASWSAELHRLEQQQPKL
jgi:hypothetical protein